MNIIDALSVADTGRDEGLMGMYPMAAQILADEVRLLRDRIDHERRDNCSICNGTGKVSDGYEYRTCQHCKPEFED